jgi:hypothetical protein
MAWSPPDRPETTYYEDGVAHEASPGLNFLLDFLNNWLIIPPSALRVSFASKSIHAVLALRAYRT